MKKTFLKNLNMRDHENIEKCNQNNLIELIHHISAHDEQLMKKRKIKQ
jgi:hypothetical protein